jgi:Tol biopolymer transport system component
MGRQGKEWAIYNATGEKRFRVTKGDTLFFFPSRLAYSPDGKRIAYSARHGQDYDIFTIGVRGGERLNVTIIRFPIRKHRFQVQGIRASRRQRRRAG